MNFKQKLKIELKREIVLKRLKALNLNNIPVPDNIHLKILKELAEVLAHPLLEIFQTLLVTGLIPCQWKANITAIFKIKKEFLLQMCSFLP